MLDNNDDGAVKLPATMSEGQSVLSDDGRNVHFFDSSSHAMLGGVFQNGAITESNFIDMLNILLVVVTQSPVAPGPFTVRARSGQTISRTSQPLAPGDYDIHVPDGGRSSHNKKKKTGLLG